MGEVYRARNTPLGRDVAIMALPDAFARDREHVTRFLREAIELTSAWVRIGKKKPRPAETPPRPLGRTGWRAEGH